MVLERQKVMRRTKPCLSLRGSHRKERVDCTNYHVVLVGTVGRRATSRIHKCPKPAKKDEDSLKNGDTINAAIASDSEREGAFFMKPESNKNSDSDLSDLETASVSDDKSEGGYGADSED